MYKIDGDSLILVANKTQTAAEPQASELTREARLIEAVRRGDEEAFAELYALFAPMVHAVLLARVPFIEVDDLVQDVFLTAYRRISTLRDERAFGGWLAMIARNRAMDFYRQRRETEELHESIALRSRSEEDAEAAKVLQVIRELPEAYRETLIMRLVEGMTGPEIAARAGLTAASVRVNLHRGMKLLREKLGVEQ